MNTSYHDAKRLPTIESAIMNEMHSNFPDFRMRKSPDNTNCENDIPSGGSGVSYQLEKKPSVSSSETNVALQKAKKSPQGWELRGVGFSLLYSQNTPDPDEQVQIKRIDLEAPCKIFIAILLLGHFISEHKWSDNLDEHICSLKTMFHDSATPLLNIFANQPESRVVEDTTPECAHVDDTTGGNKINEWIGVLANLVNRSRTYVPDGSCDRDESANVSASMMDKFLRIIMNVRNRYLTN